jgi:hypothetical protein
MLVTTAVTLQTWIKWLQCSNDEGVWNSIVQLTGLQKLLQED